MAATNGLSSLLGRARDAAGTAASMVILVGGTYAGIQAMTGGFRPALQVDVDTLAQNITRVQQDTTAIKAIIDKMPRPSDYLVQQQHLERLDTRADQFGDRLTKDEISAADVAARVTRLESGTNTPIRQPR